MKDGCYMYMIFIGMLSIDNALVCYQNNGNTYMYSHLLCACGDEASNEYALRVSYQYNY